MMNQWLKIKQEGKCLDKFFEENGYYKIVAYGISYVGETFITEIEASNVNILYGMDKMQTIFILKLQ